VATADRVLAVLSLFTLEEPEWTVDDAMRRLGMTSSSTAYEYFRSLVDAGLLTATRSGIYTVGPAVIALDRVTRRHDRLVSAATGSLSQVVKDLPPRTTALLCRSFRMQVMCVDQFCAAPGDLAISYERGRPMPLYRGAASKAILAHLAPRMVKKLWEADTAEIAAAGLGDDWDSFKANLRRMRRAPALVTRSELDPGLVGISAAVFDEDGVAGSLGIVARAEDLPSDETEILERVGAQARAVSEILRAQAAAGNRSDAGASEAE
jgi:DNA-binding IclR family transcriptional regulator